MMPKEHETSKETIGSNELRRIEAYECMHKDDDYSYVWWAYGLRDQRHIQCYQTGKYGLAIDTDRVRILHLALQKYEDTWRMIYREAIGNNLNVEVKTGKLIRSYPIMVELGKDQSAEFTVIGGMGYVPITLRNLNRYDGWQLAQIDEDGEETIIDQSVYGNDFWQTDYDQVAKQWSQTYNVNLDKNDDQIGITQFVFVQRDR